jgi:hypothetical protein
VIPMLTEYRTWLTVKAPVPRSFDDWEDLLTQLEKSYQPRTGNELRRALRRGRLHGLVSSC